MLDACDCDAWPGRYQLLSGVGIRLHQKIYVAETPMRFLLYIAVESVFEFA